ncbi:glutathione peroxidase [Undibacterium griseum]|nr:glutathione peroxidase [Undibacterium griseum]
MMSALDYTATNLQGKETDLRQYLGQVVLIVNTASQCGFTPQYKGLEEVYQQFRDQGVVVLGFPCNQFGHQEPGDADQIGHFCEKNYGVTFPLFEKVDVNGKNAHPLFQHLKSAAPGVLGTQAIKWNFTKFLIGKNGQVFKRYAPQTTPAEITDDIRALLAMT